jgi:hypothetical protein
MSFTSSEFPGLVITSLEELERLRRYRDKLRKQLSVPLSTVVKPVPEEEGK